MNEGSTKYSAEPHQISEVPTANVVGGLVVGEPVIHAELGEGVLLRLDAAGYARVLFRQHGERQVPVTALARTATWDEQVVSSLQPATPDALRRLWLAIEAERLPLMDSAAALTSAKSMVRDQPSGPHERRT